MFTETIHFSQLLPSYPRRSAIGSTAGTFRLGGTVLTATGRVGKFRYHTGAAGIDRWSVLRTGTLRMIGSLFSEP